MDLKFKIVGVTILILVDGFLQSLYKCIVFYTCNRHNPYFSRWFSAIMQIDIKNINMDGHNPYFSRWFSAIISSIKLNKAALSVTILILVDGFLQLKKLLGENYGRACHNPYFSRWFSAIETVIKVTWNYTQCHNPYFSRWFSAIGKVTI